MEEGTKLAYDIDNGLAPEPDGDARGGDVQWSMERLGRAGYRQYEISNWCLPGEECRHNLVYWRNGEWFGLGAGAHSHWGGHRFANVYSRSSTSAASRKPWRRPSTQSWPPAPDILRAMRRVTFDEAQAPDAAMADTAILALRLNEGLDIASFEQRFGQTLDAAYGPVITEFAALGLLERQNGPVAPHFRGRLLANGSSSASSPTRRGAACRAPNARPHSNGRGAARWTTSKPRMTRGHREAFCLTEPRGAAPSTPSVARRLAKLTGTKPTQDSEGRSRAALACGLEPRTPP